jgi:hypothetical protein
MHRALALLFALVASVSLAQDKKDEPKKDELKKDDTKPGIVKAPDGWKFVKAKDASHAFLIPRDVKSEESSEGTFKSGGFSGKTARHVAEGKDARTFVIVQTNLGGPATKDFKITDVYDLMYESDKAEKGVAITESKEITVGKRKGREWFVTDKESVRRVVTVVVPGRVIQLAVEVDKKSRDKLADKDSDTFLTTLILYASPKKDEKKDAPKTEPKKDDKKVAPTETKKE